MDFNFSNTVYRFSVEPLNRLVNLTTFYCWRLWALLESKSLCRDPGKFSIYISISIWVIFLLIVGQSWGGGVVGESKGEELARKPPTTQAIQFANSWPYSNPFQPLTNNSSLVTEFVVVFLTSEKKNFFLRIRSFLRTSGQVNSKYWRIYFI